MSRRLFLGIDTSNYTTSAALAAEDGAVLANIKLPLPVADGARGLRQSDAVFSHIKALPTAAAALRELLSGTDPSCMAAIGVSAVPRDVEGSYMPCFLSGIAAAETAGALLQVPVYHFSHQAGHVMAALRGAEAMHLADAPFAAFHVSGGTTDVLLAQPHAERIFEIETVGGTRDINAGQAIDRVGVHMGLHFPAGAAMEQLALSYTKKTPRAKISVDGTHCNLSGLENQALAFYRETEDRAATAAYVLSAVARTLCGMRDGLRALHGDIPIVYAGGVMSCSLLRDSLADTNAFFAPPPFSSDNAVGAAFLARRRFLAEEERAE